MATAKKITNANHTEGIKTIDDRSPVYAKKFNELVDVVNELEPSDGTLAADTIQEYTSGSGVTIDGVILKDNSIQAASSVVVGTNISVGGTVTMGGTTTSTGAGAVAITGAIHEITTTGVGDALTLADGAEGQRLVVVYVAEGAGADTAVLTPTNLAGGTTITFNALGDSANLIFTAGAWYFLGGAAVVA